MVPPAAARYEVDLYLLMTMICHDAVKRAVLEHVGVSEGEANDARERVSALLEFGPRQFGNFARLIGRDLPSDPDSALVYRTKLWPRLDFVVVGVGGYWRSAKLQRAQGESATVVVADPQDIAPLTYTVDELRAGFGPLVEGDSMAPYEEFLFEANGFRYGATASWGFVQRVRNWAGDHQALR
ncbi:hypothetical protein [Nocardia camponoti]|uniref:Uncharacterized protein n=1 Tax=Nocardia camponoti TaxID=1616106 RepID=A0A917VAY4_9NOCA|nr:hypothetical protein [Nocardia camponoti]GGK55568.1 hypothetical protein GCM10011591_29500 [Nocardia camponoti]